jgi:hypothetical protein
MELIDCLKSDDLIPLKRMGPVVCVAIIESSSRAPSRMMACKECCACVEHIGLSGIGKKGVLVAAKSLSEEKFPENRNALLDLIELLLSRMNSDMQRFARICGANLSGKARCLIEERLERTNTNEASSTATPSRSGIPPPGAKSESKLSRPSRIPNPPKSPAPLQGRLATGHTRPTHVPHPNDEGDNGNSQSSNFGDELPALELRFGAKESASSFLIPRGSSSSIFGTAGLSGSGSSDLGSAPSSPHGRHTAMKPDGSQRSLVQNMNYSFSGADDDNSTSSRHGESAESEMGLPEERRASSYHSPLKTSSAESTESGSHDASVGAAASLRARLMRIREKNKVSLPELGTTSKPLGEPGTDSYKNDSYSSQKQEAALRLIETEDVLSDIIQGSQDSHEQGVAKAGLNAGILDQQLAGGTAGSASTRREDFNMAVSNIEILVSRQTPIDEDDVDLIACTNSLKTIHAAVSKQPHLVTELEEEDVARLREIVVDHTNEMVANLTR